MDQPSSLSELNAATVYVAAWNQLDCSIFIELLAEDASYASQWVFSELEGKNTIQDYLVKKMNAVRNGGSPVYAELGKTSLSFPDRDCTVLAQGDKEKVSAVVLFEVAAGKIKRFDLCIPELLRAIRTGTYPR